jgi:hypothetical protein
MSPRWASDGTLNMPPNRTVSLRDVGGGDYALAAAVSPGGAMIFLLQDTASLERVDVVLGITQWPRHERLGMLLGREWRRCRIVLGQPVRNRCHRPTCYGDPCLARVGTAGRACRHHRDAEQPGAEGARR